MVNIELPIIYIYFMAYCHTSHIHDIVKHITNTPNYNINV